METMTIGGWEVSYFYQPAERSSLEHQGCNESIEIYKVMSKGKNITGIINIEKLERKMYDYEYEY